MPNAPKLIQSPPVDYIELWEGYAKVASPPLATVETNRVRFKTTPALNRVAEVRFFAPTWDLALEPALCVYDLAPTFDLEWECLGGTQGGPVHFTVGISVYAPVDPELESTFVMWSYYENIHVDYPGATFHVTPGASGVVHATPTYYKDAALTECQFAELPYPHGFVVGSIQIERAIAAAWCTFSSWEMDVRILPTGVPLPPIGPSPEGAFWTGYQKVTEAVLA